MKVLLPLFAALVATSSSLAAADPSDKLKNKQQHHDSLRRLHEDDAVGAQTWPGGATYYKYFTGSCSCVGDAIDDILAASSRAVDKLPFDDFTHEFLMKIIDGLAHCAIDFLHGLDCGCDDDYTGIPQQQWLEVPAAVTNTYQCCCDVEAIRDATVHQIEAVACSWNVDMHGKYMGATVDKLCDFGFYASAYARLQYLIEQVGGQYLPALFPVGGGTVHPKPEVDPFGCVVPDIPCPVVPVVVK